MTLRLLRHGAAGCTEHCNLRPGAWSDVSTQGQFLLDLEFLLNSSPSSGTASCVYCRSPPYLHEIAQQFPWIHFFAYEHVFDTPEYDPAQPSLVSSVPPTVQVDFNKTICVQEFTKDMARAMGERGQRERESLLLICHGVGSVRQLALQVLMRPQHALLDLAGSIPTEYLEGDIVLPMYLPGDVLFACMTVKANAKGKSYDSNTYMHEMGFFQGVIRSTPAYDGSCRELIARQYARLAHRYHGCSEDDARHTLLSLLDLLWADPRLPHAQ